MKINGEYFFVKQKFDKIKRNENNSTENKQKSTNISQKSAKIIQKHPKSDKNQPNLKNSEKNIKNPNISNKNQQNLTELVENLFDEKNKVENQTFFAKNEKIMVFYIECLIDKKLLSNSIISPIEKALKNNSNFSKNADFFKNEVLSISGVQETADIADIEDAVFSGSVVVVSKTKAFICPLFSPEKRSIAEPPTSRVIKGPREGFVEDIFTNEGLVRKRLKTSDLKIEDIVVGRRTKTQISLFYIENIAKPEVVSLVKKRLNSIDIDAIIDSYYIESFLETDNLKFFKRVGNTEKPDIFVAKILEGRVGILVDGSPVALTVPFLLFEDIQSAEDYYNIPAQATFSRIIRLIGLIFALMIPGVYVSLQSYNYRILPINFLITLLSSIEGLSIPPLVEIMIVLFLFEIITEASLRMPNSLGMALSIIGALALGNTAVDAGIISPPSIVVVAISSVAIYIIPDQIPQTRLLRLIFTAIGGIVGLYGVITTLIILTTYLCLIESFGVPYLTPFAPSIKTDKKDGYIKQPIQKMVSRPALIVDKNKTRQGGEDES